MDVDFSGEWDSVLYIQARVVLYALLVSHIVVCHSPGLSMDTSYIRLFRALEQSRYCGLLTRYRPDIDFTHLSHQIVVATRNR